MANLQQFINNGATTLAAGILDTDLSFDVVDATLLPSLGVSEWFYLTLTQASTETSWEIVKVTAVAGNTLTVVRAQQGTAAAAWAAGDKAENRITSADCFLWDAATLINSADTQVLFNDGGATGGDSDLTFNKVTKALTHSGVVYIDNGAGTYEVRGPDGAVADGMHISWYAGNAALGSNAHGGTFGFLAGDADGTGNGGTFSVAAGNSPGGAGGYLLLLAGDGVTPGLIEIYCNGVTWVWPVTDGSSGQAFVTDGAGGLGWSSLQPASTQLTSLAALSYTGNALKVIRVNAGETGFELATVTSASGADPTASVGLSAVNGVAATFMRSDGAPALSQAIVPTWTGIHTWSFATGAASQDGVVLATSSTATSGNQKWSPRLRLKGSYFSGSAKTTDFIIENQPTSSGGLLSISHSDNGGAVTYPLRIRSDATVYFRNHPSTTFGPYLQPDVYALVMGYYNSADGSLNQAFKFEPGNVVLSILGNNGSVAFGVSGDLMLYRAAAANLRQGGAAANPPIPQYTSVQNASGTNIAGATRYYVGSLATGNAVSGGHAFQVGVPGASGTTLQTAETQLTIGYHTATWVDALDFVFGSTTGTKIGTATTQKIGFYNATPVVQPTNVTNPTGGATIDSEARTAIDAILTRLETLGLFAA